MTLDKFGRSSTDIYKKIKPIPGTGFALTKTGDYDMQNKILTNLKYPENETDAVNKIYVDKLIEQLVYEIKINKSEIKSTNRTFTSFKADTQKIILDMKRSFMIHINNLEMKHNELLEQWEKTKL